MLFAHARGLRNEGDAYHLRSAIGPFGDYPSWNLSEEAREMAQEGFLRFEKLAWLRSRKNAANEAIAYGQQGKNSSGARTVFAKARECCAGKESGVALAPDCTKDCSCSTKRYFEARRLCAGAAGFFDQTLLSGKSRARTSSLAASRSQLGRAGSRESETENWPSQDCASAKRRCSGLQAHFLRGTACQGRGDPLCGSRRYGEARRALRNSRSRLHSEELKISFVKNRLQVYESLVDLHLSGETGEDRCRRKLCSIERQSLAA